MLVLTRFINQSIRIADNIEVKVTQIGNGRVTLSFNAPDSVKILRKELLEESPQQPLTVPPAI